MMRGQKWIVDDVACEKPPFPSERRIYECQFARIVRLIDEICTKRIHIEEEIRGRTLTELKEFNRLFF